MLQATRIDKVLLLNTFQSPKKMSDVWVAAVTRRGERIFIKWWSDDKRNFPYLPGMLRAAS